MNASVARLNEPAAAAWPEWPNYGLAGDLLPVLAQWHAQGLGCALATLVDVQGSAPRPVGSEMAICSDGRVAGYLSGGCVEAAIALEAAACIEDGQARYLDYGSGSPVLDIQLSCGGRIGILVRPLPDLGEYLARWSSARARRMPFRLGLHLCTGQVRYLAANGPLAEDEVLQVYPAPIRLVLFGADPAVLALLELAPRFGMDVMLVRPHGPVHPPLGLSTQQYDHRALTPALKALQLDARCAVYSLMHDEQADLHIMQAALASSAACVGVLGSRSKRQRRLEALQAQGVDAADLDRLRLPAGQRIATSSPYAIASGIITEAIEAVAGID